MVWWWNDDDYDYGYDGGGGGGVYGDDHLINILLLKVVSAVLFMFVDWGGCRAIFFVFFNVFGNLLIVHLFVVLGVML